MSLKNVSPTIYLQYEIVNDFPGFYKGMIIKFDKRTRLYQGGKLIPCNSGEGVLINGLSYEQSYCDFAGNKFSIEEVKNTEYFKPIEKTKIILFPKLDRKSIFDEKDGCLHYLGETRHNNSCLICCTLDRLYSSEVIVKKIQDELFKVVEEFYNKEIEDFNKNNKDTKLLSK